jgi:hypothetical protein
MLTKCPEGPCIGRIPSNCARDLSAFMVSFVLVHATCCTKLLWGPLPRLPVTGHKGCHSAGQLEARHPAQSCPALAWHGRNVETLLTVIVCTSVHRWDDYRCR